MEHIETILTACDTKLLEKTLKNLNFWTHWDPLPEDLQMTTQDGLILNIAVDYTVGQGQKVIAALNKIGAPYIVDNDNDD